MPKIAFATYYEFPNLTENDKLLIPIFNEYGYEITAEVWDDEKVDWEKYDAVIIRSTWDYFLKFDVFSIWISSFIGSSTKLLNSPTIVLENANKFYLKKLQEKGITIIPTWFSCDDISFEHLNKYERIVIKPAISAGSHKTEVLDTQMLSKEVFDAKISTDDWLVQPFIKAIEKDGEISLVFIAGKFSHAVRKTPQEGDFRVQKQFGGKYEKFEPSESLIAKAKNIVHVAAENALYARVDGLIVNNDFLLMEIEMVEPDLFFEFTDNGARNFVERTLECLE
jgi:glutathione synthase/RimK-type ligase-like ATP-grasp enzyme